MVIGRLFITIIKKLWLQSAESVFLMKLVGRIIANHNQIHVHLLCRRGEREFQRVEGRWAPWLERLEQFNRSRPSQRFVCEVATFKVFSNKTKVTNQTRIPTPEAPMNPQPCWVKWARRLYKGTTRPGTCRVFRTMMCWPLREMIADPWPRIGR